MFCPRCGSSVALFNYFKKSKEGREPMVGVNVCDLNFLYYSYGSWGMEGEGGEVG